ncbi:threonine synthase [Aeropyrum pernix K1]|uniref:Threonine synthase n=1 Tax=Aeropyrum pernix (strain ATCC 700893 / DSM 11879 / JCM 9820 / NBRC 100138 / K1) TaxID=272557 RepID=Q9Y9K2_AERPE|nr:threonine synthase [Aeropyrum pernix K1]
MACGSKYPSSPRLFTCPKCGGLLEPFYIDGGSPRGRGVWRYRDLLPRPRRIVTMGEGSTPLVKLENLSRAMGVEVYGKLEFLNPTGSFKDRGMTVGVSIASSFSYRLVVAASTGNTAASMAAYARRAGLNPVILIPKGGIASGKLSQIAALGAWVLEVEGSFDDALDAARAAAEKGLAYSLNSINPYRLEGQKTIAFEILEDVDRVDHVVVPVGNAGNISAIWKGFKEAGLLGLPSMRPRMVGVQAEGASPLYRAWVEKMDSVERVRNPSTIASAIRIGNPVNAAKALAAVRESDGLIISVSDAEILKAAATLAENEGMLVEPASAASLAGLIKLRNQGIIASGSSVVLILTGHGLKDPRALEFIASSAGVRRAYASTAEEALLKLEEIAVGG